MDNRIELYVITGAYADASAALKECETEGEYTAALEAWDAVETDMTTAFTATAMMLRNLQARAERQAAQAKTFKSEYERMNARAKATEAAAERLKERVLFAMETADLKRIRTDIGTWYIVDVPKCDVKDPHKVPNEFVKGYNPEIDKAAAKAHFVATGELIEGLDLRIEGSVRFR